MWGKYLVIADILLQRHGRWLQVRPGGVDLHNGVFCRAARGRLRARGTACLAWSAGAGTLPQENGWHFGFEEVLRSSRETTAAWPVPDRARDVPLSVQSLWKPGYLQLDFQGEGGCIQSASGDEAPVEELLYPCHVVSR